jgi:hypothetical protein
LAEDRDSFAICTRWTGRVKPSERLDDGCSLILAEEANDKLGGGSYAATNDFPFTCRAPSLSQVAAHLARRRQPALARGLRNPPLNANTGPTMSEAGPAPPAFDRYGAANFDSHGTYTGGHGIGTQVDNPDQPDQTTFGIPKSSIPDISSLHCTGSSISNAGTMNCTN